MQKRSLIIAAFVVALGSAASTALAETPMQDGRGLPEREPSAGTHLQMPGVIAPSGSATFEPESEHVMTGTITALDRTKGTLSLRTAQTDLDLHFPPPALQDLNVGEQIAVKLSLSKDAAAAAGSSANMPTAPAIPPPAGPDSGAYPESNAADGAGTD